jgi:hypothetical protein
VVKARFLLALAVVGVAILTTPLAANPRVDFVSNWAKTDNMTALGFSPRLVEFPGPAAGRINSDLAFWGDMVVQGTYEGFRLIDVTYPSRPKEIINYEECAPDSTAGNQGDVLIYGDILVRSWNSNAPSATPVTCDGQTVPGGFEGLHIFSIANKQNPQLLTSIDLACGSHTASMLPDLANGRLIVFNGSSSGTCENIDIIGIPLANPAAAAVIRQEPTADHPCHDIGIIYNAEAKKLGCAGGTGFEIFSLDPMDGATLTDPVAMHHVEVPGVTVGHSAIFSTDGKVLVFGHEPGGGTQPRCTATGTVLPGGLVQTDDMKSYFFYDAETGDQLGKFVLPRNQTVAENCTIHNYNMIPLKKKNGKPRYVLVAGNYQAGISVVDFSDPANAKEIAYADPPPVVPEADYGDWSTYWYNGRIYESDIQRGLIIWRLDDDRVGTYLRTPYSNPQTQEYLIDR